MRNLIRIQVAKRTSCSEGGGGGGEGMIYVSVDRIQGKFI